MNKAMKEELPFHTLKHAVQQKTGRTLYTSYNEKKSLQILKKKKKKERKKKTKRTSYRIGENSFK